MAHCLSLTKIAEIESVILPVGEHHVHHLVFKRFAPFVGYEFTAKHHAFVATFRSETLRLNVAALHHGALVGSGWIFHKNGSVVFLIK